MENLEKSIIATVCYYDILDYPLTGFEIYKYLVNSSRIDNREYIANISFNNILNALESSSEIKKIIQEKNGFYFLQNREKILPQRIKRQKLADQKWKKARKIIWLLQIIPYLRMIAVSGSLALGNTRKNSDIDLLIITKAGRIWTCRTLITILITLLGKKHHKGKTRDRICLNHYITDKSLRIPFESLYNAQTYARLVNLYDFFLPLAKGEIKRRFFEKFQESNFWVKNYLFFRLNTKGKNLRMINKNKILISFAKFSEFVLDNRAGNQIENILGKWQEKRIKSDPLFKKPDGRITADKNQLEFHPESHEVKIVKNFNQKMRDLELSELANQKDSGLNL
jgi:predicted nucleotidyltransferase